MSPRFWVGIATTGILLHPAISQTTGGGSATIGTIPIGSGTIGGRTLPSNNQGDSNSTTDSAISVTAVGSPSLTVSGRILLEDGTPPAVGTVVERNCNGSSHAEGYTDAKGYFIVTLGQNRDMIIDAGDSSSDSAMGRPFPQLTNAGEGEFGTGTGSSRGQLLDNRYSNCDIRARLGGYRSQSASLVDYGARDNVNIGVILLHRIGPAESDTVDASSLAAPKNARKAYTTGMEFIRKQRQEDARKSFANAVRLYPGYAAAWLELGKMQARAHLADARNSFEAARKAEPRMVAPYLELSLLALHAKNWAELADDTDRVIKLDSFDYPQAFFLNAVANYNLGNMGQAEENARAAKRLDTRHRYSEAAHLLAVILMDRHEYAAAAAEFRDYLVMAPNAVAAEQIRKQLDDLERLTIPPAQLARKEQ
jgi:tetratricopeptide (TPR) repeat protein